MGLFNKAKKAKKTASKKSEVVSHEDTQPTPVVEVDDVIISEDELKFLLLETELKFLQLKKKGFSFKRAAAKIAIQYPDSELKGTSYKKYIFV